MQKKGQFFLIAALIISAITIGFGTLYNNAQIERQDVQVYELSEELRSELHQAYDSGVVNEKAPLEIQKDIETLAQFYAIQNPDSNIVVIYGNETSLVELEYNQEQGDSYLIQSEAGTQTTPEGTILENEEESRGQPTDRQVLDLREGEHKKIQLKSKPKKRQAWEKPNLEEDTDLVIKEFDIKKGQNFYLVVRKKVKNEEVVIYR